jgi:hypothetical protein
MCVRYPSQIIADSNWGEKKLDFLEKDLSKTYLPTTNFTWIDPGLLQRLCCERLWTNWSKSCSACTIQRKWLISIRKTNQRVRDRERPVCRPWVGRERSVCGPWADRDLNVSGPLAGRNRAVGGPCAGCWRALIGPWTSRERAVIGPWADRELNVSGTLADRERAFYSQ